MASTTNASGTTGSTDLVAQLTQMSNRTNLMVLDATLRALPKDGLGNGAGIGAGDGGAQGFAAAAADVRALARRMLLATQDLQATICEPAE